MQIHRWDVGLFFYKQTTKRCQSCVKRRRSGGAERRNCAKAGQGLTPVYLRETHLLGTFPIGECLVTKHPYPLSRPCSSSSSASSHVRF